MTPQRPSDRAQSAPGSREPSDRLRSALRLIHEAGTMLIDIIGAANRAASLLALAQRELEADLAEAPFPSAMAGAPPISRTAAPDDAWTSPAPQRCGGAVRSPADVAPQHEGEGQP